MSIPFLKVQGAGNDFLLIDALGENAHLSEVDWPALAPRICDRHFGVGADGILIAQDTDVAAARMVIVNSDGSDGEMCGNGFRCFTKYLVERVGMTPTDGALSIETGAGVLQADLSSMTSASVDRVRVDMGRAWLQADEIPVVHEGPAPILDHQVGVDGRTLDLTCVSMGNPHAVWFTDVDVDEFPLTEIGPLIETHPDFPRRTNFEIVNLLAPDHLKMRVWERGVGITMACGSGACAVLVAARLRGLVDAAATVSLPGGDLEIAWDGLDDPSASVYMTGPASFSFEGQLDANLLSVR
ncbi:MAG: diaminopimelate epimerase [Chloroflexota bacterium]|nr:diaminopimelate epimerase [Chloroflexota bacterium]MDE2895280.1 diaminopimelate epimerase [Chloroflexota bacterium]